MKILALLIGVISLGGINSNVNEGSNKVADDFVPNHKEALKWLIRFNYMVSNLGNQCYNILYLYNVIVVIVVIVVIL